MLTSPGVYSPISDVNWVLEILRHKDHIQSIHLKYYSQGTIHSYVKVEISFKAYLQSTLIRRARTLETLSLSLGTEYGILPLPPMFPFTHSNLEENAWPRSIKKKPKNIL